MADNVRITTGDMTGQTSEDASLSGVRRLIEVDLPIRRISEHSRREKSIRHGHISTLHAWWARRPLGACRAIICAALWPDPVDPLCPDAFRETAREWMQKWAMNQLGLAGEESFGRLVSLQKCPQKLDDDHELRKFLLDFIADFADWDNSTDQGFLEISRALTKAAHEALGGDTQTRPLIIDPFAGGGSIPLEALRVGADVFASDLNPIPVLLNKVILEYLPTYGKCLAEELRKWGEWVKEQAEPGIRPYFPIENATQPPVAYLWARTILCEGPGCGVEVPMIRSLWLAKKGQHSVALGLRPDKENKTIVLEVIKNASKASGGTVQRGSVTCPVCGYTTPVSRVRQQLNDVFGGADSSRLLAVVHRSSAEKTYSIPSEQDLKAIEYTKKTINRHDVIPKTELPLMSGVFNVPLYGIKSWDLLFSARQLLAAKAIGDQINTAFLEMPTRLMDGRLREAVKILLLMALDKHLDFRSTLCAWINVGEKIGHTFGRQALGMIFDWAEGVPFGDISGSWERSVAYIAEFLETEAEARLSKGVAEQSSAQRHPLPDNSAQAFITDPPYYNAVPYADLSDFFYIWLRKGLIQEFPSLFSESSTPKSEELCEMSGWDPVRYSQKDAAFYETGMRKALSEGRRICIPSGIGVIVFAHKTTTGWESLLSALIDSGWIVTASWPIDTERGGRLRAMNSAALASSVHLVCRPRENPDGSLREEIGDWRDVLQQLPQRIHEWMPRLAQEGVVGADAIFACLGPALEIFSRYSRVEKASGEQVMLREYLEYVWAAVAKEALNMIFEGADATGFEEDARLTAMWMWTLSTAQSKNGKPSQEATAEDDDSEEDESDSSSSKKKKAVGFSLEYDAARKIAQGLGAYLEKLDNLIEIKGDTARLLSVAERTRYLFGKDNAESPTTKRKKKEAQMKLGFIEELERVEAEESWGQKDAPRPGSTTLDRVHQAMILFAAGRAEAMKRFLVEEGAGNDARFWRLAQALAALYPSGTDEKRWVEGVLARKKRLGF